MSGNADPARFIVFEQCSPGSFNDGTLSKKEEPQKGAAIRYRAEQ
jgi:hypothetical protein